MATTPTISQVTPMELMRAMTFTPMELIVVVIASNAVPRTTALAAPSLEVSAVSVPTI